MKTPAPVFVIDPAVRRPELEAFNSLALRSPLPLSYHLPALHGMQSLQLMPSEPAAIIVFGSASSVHERTEWQKALEAWLLPKMNSGVPTLGICYGHQMISYLYGGKVAYHHPKQEKFVELREVALSPDVLWKNQALKGKLYYSHNEIVTDCPKEFDVIGRSERFPLEALKHQRLPIWTFQSHPEVAKGELPLPQEAIAFGSSVIDGFLSFVRNEQA